MQTADSRNKKRAWTSFPFWTAALFSTLIFVFTGSTNIRAGCIDLADEPLEIQSMGAPGIIMFVYDNSGSMAYSVMCKEDEGMFHAAGNEYGYLYADDKKNVIGDVIQGDPDATMRWKSQWSGYNKVYYDPTVLYEPWPAWTTIADVKTPLPAAAPQADPDNPRSNLITETSTFDLGGEWETIDVGAGFDVADLIRDQGIIVDNDDEKSDDENTRVLVVDDMDADNFNIEFEGGTWYPDNSDAAYYNSDYSTYFAPTKVAFSATATWNFYVTNAGKYDVLASIPKDTSRVNDLSDATYTITHSGGATEVIDANQYNKSGEIQVWESFGAYDFDEGPVTVELNFSAFDKQTRRSIGVDAIQLVPQFAFDPATYSTWSGPWGTRTGSAFETERYLHDYRITEINEPHTFTWTAEGLSHGTKYSAYVKVLATDYRSDAVQYTVDGTTVSIDQRYSPESDNYWVLLKDNISFSEDTGVVELRTSQGDYKVIADAVAFVPTPPVAGTPVKIVNAHYYVQNGTGTYLVNLDGAIKYYRVVSTDDDVVNGELFEITENEAIDLGIYTGRGYTRERQNFANWFQFARTRDKVSRFALGKLVESMGNIYFGLTTVPSRDIYAVRSIKEAMVSYRDDTLDVLNNVYNLPNPSGATPLKDGFLKVAEYFEGAASLVNAHDKAYFVDGGYATVDTYPYLNAENGGECQQAFLIAMTDGLYNMNAASNIDNHDGNNDSEWDGGEFGDDFESGTLADISMDFYERDMKTMLANEVPTNEWDKNSQQHVVTYALTFGVEGSIVPGDWPDCPKAMPRNDNSCPEWEWPVEGELSTIDDMYHATVNGRGLFLNAGNPKELVAALMKIKANIEERLGSSAAVTTSSVQRQIGSNLYRGEYMTGKWTGDLKAFEIDVDTGAVYPDYKWSARNQLDLVTDYTDRKIYSYDGSSGMLFDFNSMTSDQKTRLSDGLAYAFGTDAAYAFGTIDAGDVENLVNYLRGDVSEDEANGGPFRARANLLGDIVHSEAEYHDHVLYVGANDGMLHAIHSETGNELATYVPNMLYSELPKLALPNYQHQYFLNNTPFVMDTGMKKLLVCPMGKGYKGLFALDVTIPMGEADPTNIPLWEYPGAGAIDPDLGYTYSQATIFKTKAAGWVVITGNGYESVNGHAVLYLMDALTGTVVAKLDTGVGGCNGLSSPAIVDPDSNGEIDFVYAGDLKGNMWKFDLRGATVADWKVAFNDGTNPQPLITVTDSSGTPQPITTAPGVMFVNECNPPGSDGLLLLFGTGKYLGFTDTTDLSHQSVYGVYDWALDWEAETGSSEDKYLGTLTTGPPRTLSNTAPGVGKDLILVQQSIVKEADMNGETYRFITNNEVSYYNLETKEGGALGWYMDLPDDGERMVRRPVVRSNVFTFVANIPEKSPCTAGGRSYLYQVDACSGGWPEEPQFDLDGDGDFDEDDLIDLDVDGDGSVDLDDLLAVAYDADGDGVVTLDDVLLIFDKNGNGVIDSDEIPGNVPPIGQEFDSLLLDPTLLQDVIYLNDLDEVVGKNVPPLPVGAWFWQVIE